MLLEVASGRGLLSTHGLRNTGLPEVVDTDCLRFS